MQIHIRGDSMWPTLRDGDLVAGVTPNEVAVGDIIVYRHPLQSGLSCVKRIKRIEADGIFVEGDNPDPTASEDSHNHGMIPLSAIIAKVLIDGSE